MSRLQPPTHPLRRFHTGRTMIPLAQFFAVAIGGAGWLIGRSRGSRWLRACSAAIFAAAFVSVAGSVGYTIGVMQTRVELGQEYVVRLDAFRAAALDRLNAGDADAVAAEFRRLEGRFTYDHGPTFRELGRATEALSAGVPPGASAAAP